MAEEEGGARPPGDKGSFKKLEAMAASGAAVAAFPDQSKAFSKDLRNRLSARSGNSIPLPDSSDEDEAPAAAPVAEKPAVEQADANADVANLQVLPQPQEDPPSSAAPGTLEFNNQLSMRLKELEGRARVETRERGDSSFMIVDSKRASVDARVENTAALDSLSFQSAGGREAEAPAPAPPPPAPEPAAPVPPPGRPNNLPRMSMREAKAETTKVLAAIANETNRVDGLRSDNASLRKRAGLAATSVGAAAPGPTDVVARPTLGRAKSKDAMQMQVQELMDRQAALEKEAEALQEENFHLKKRLEEQDDQSSLLAELEKSGTDSFTQGAAQIAASARDKAYGGAAREVKISAAPAAPAAPVGKRSSGAGAPVGKRDSTKRDSAKREAAPEVEMTSRLSDGGAVPPVVSAAPPAQASAKAVVPSRLSSGGGSGGRGSAGNPSPAAPPSAERVPAREDAQPLRGDPTPDPPQSCCKKCCVIS